MVERLQEEILSMTVRKELLAKAMDQINQKHQVSLLGFFFVTLLLINLSFGCLGKDFWFERLYRNY